MRSKVRFAALGALLLLPLTVSAQTLFIDPAVVDSSDQVQQALADNPAHASTSIEGAGSTLSITYAANEPIQVFLVPLDTSNNFVPTDFLTFVLPQTNGGDAVIDMTKSPGWKPGTQKWLMHLLTKTEDAQAGFSRVEFVPASSLRILHAAFTHLMTPEPYTPSSYHALRGYRVFGIPVAISLGILTVVAAIAALLIARKHRMQACLAVLIIASGLWQLRFSVDLLGFTNQHLREFYTDKHVYDEAGSVHLIAQLLKFGQPDDVVYVCRDGTNYKEKLLRYFAYPVKISSDASVASTANYALVMDKEDWSLETTTANKQTLQTLHCNDVNRPAEFQANFEDGSRLYRLF